MLIDKPSKAGISSKNWLGAAKQFFVSPLMQSLKFRVFTNFICDSVNN
jgi:hypothetical protein